MKTKDYGALKMPWVKEVKDGNNKESYIKTYSKNLRIENLPSRKKYYSHIASRIHQTLEDYNVDIFDATNWPSGSFHPFPNRERQRVITDLVKTLKYFNIDGYRHSIYEVWNHTDSQEF